MRLLDRFNHFARENPMKVYPLVYITGDAIAALHGTGESASLIWSLGAGLGIAAHSLKLAFGKGGEKIAGNSLTFSARELSGFFKNFAVHSIQTLKPSFWYETGVAFAKSKGSDVWSKLKNCLTHPHRYPLDAGYVLIAGAGTAYMTDALNVFGLRPETSALQAAFGASILGASITGFVTNRNDLAGNIFCVTGLLGLTAGMVSGSVPLLMSVPISMMGNYILSQVKTDYQSSFTTAQQLKI